MKERKNKINRQTQKQTTTKKTKPCCLGDGGETIARKACTEKEREVGGITEAEKEER